MSYRKLIMNYILSIDQGTSSSRAILFDSQGKIHAKAQVPLHLTFPEPGFVELDAEMIFKTVKQACLKVIEQGNISPSQIAAIGITNQRETTVIWDRSSGKPIYNAIVWQDRRTAPTCDLLRNQNHQSWIHKKTGLVLDPYFSALKIKYILDLNPEIRKKAEIGALCFGTIESWICYNLSAGSCHVTDVTNASRTMLFNIHEKKWDEELLSFFSIPKSILPEVVDNCLVVGSATNLFENISIPIAAMMGDQQAALFGQKCFDPGQSKATYGTGCFFLVNTGSYLVENTAPLLTTIASQLWGKTTYAVEGSVFHCGTILQFLKDNLKLFSSYQEIEKAASECENTSGVIFIPAFTGLGAPYWAPYAKAEIVGLTLSSNKNHIARACFEAICYQTFDLIECMKTNNHLTIVETNCDGMVATSDFLMQFQADILNIKLTRLEDIEISAKGVAFLAGLSIGIWKSLDEIKSLPADKKTFTPKMNAQDRDLLLKNWKLAVLKILRN